MFRLHTLQTTIQPSLKYHITLRDHTTLFKVPHHPLQSTTQPSTKYHIPYQPKDYLLKQYSSTAKFQQESVLANVLKDIKLVKSSHQVLRNAQFDQQNCADMRPLRTLFDPLSKQSFG